MRFSSEARSSYFDRLSVQTGRIEGKKAVPNLPCVILLTWELSMNALAFLLKIHWKIIDDTLMIH